MWYQVLLLNEIHEFKVNQFFYYNILFNIKYTTMREMSERTI